VAGDVRILTESRKSGPYAKGGLRGL